MKRHSVRDLSCWSALITILVMATGPATAQPFRKISEIEIDDSDCRGIQVGADGLVYASTFDSGELVIVDAQNPFAPMVVPGGRINPAFGDQFGEPLLTGDFIVSGHRFGGNNLIDVRDPGDPLQADSVDTHYHFNGLAALEMDGTTYVFEAEHNAFGSNGGLIIYDIGAGTLAEEGRNTGSLRDGRDLAVTQDGQWAYLYNFSGCGNDGTYRLDVYNTSDKANPALAAGCVDIGGVVGNVSTPDILLSADDDILYVAGTGSGLRILDVSTRTSPTTLGILQNSVAEFRDLDLYHPSILLAIARLVDTGDYHLAVLNISDPTLPSLVAHVSTDLAVAFDVAADRGLIYVCGRNDSGAGVVQIWL